MVGNTRIGRYETWLMQVQVQDHPGSPVAHGPSFTGEITVVLAICFSFFGFWLKQLSSTAFQSQLQFKKFLLHHHHHETFPSSLDNLASSSLHPLASHSSYLRVLLPGASLFTSFLSFSLRAVATRQAVSLELSNLVSGKRDRGPGLCGRPQLNSLHSNTLAHDRSSANTIPRRAVVDCNSHYPTSFLLSF